MAFRSSKVFLNEFAHGHFWHSSVEIASKELAPELALRPTFLATAAMTTDQGSKLRMGKCKGIFCEYENQQVINFNRNPFTVTLIATNKANTGMLLSLQNSFDAVLAELHKVIDVQ